MDAIVKNIPLTLQIIQNCDQYDGYGQPNDYIGMYSWDLCLGDYPIESSEGYYGSIEKAIKDFSSELAFEIGAM